VSQQVARIDDTISHGGVIIEGSATVVTNSRLTARLGDAVICNIHGLQKIVTASSTVFANSRGVARVGDLVSCGAVIVSGSPNTYAGG
jgi:uncharacterized Zn-binding protein involved in type VI secretion